MARRENLLGWLLASPWLIGFVLFVAGPIIASVALSLTSWDILRPPRFVGFANYVQLIFGQTHFWQSVRVTTLYAVVNVPLRLLLALLIAVLLNQRVKLLGAWRTIYYVPSVVSGVAVAFLWQWIFNADFGLVNWALETFFGVRGPGWLVDPDWALPALILMSLWSFGAPMVIFLAGLQGIPTELHEAAAIDGAATVQRFLYVTIPLLTPVVLFNLVLGLIDALQMFTQSFIITNGGPANATLTMMLYLYDNAFQNLRMGYASAIAWLLFLYIMILTALIFKWSRSWAYYEGSRRERG